MTIDLEQMARNIRKWSVIAIKEAGSGHPGSCMSVAEIITILLGEVMRHDVKNPDDPKRDRLILSKGHACPALYAALAEVGYIDHKELYSLRKLGSRLQGHPSLNHLPFVETSTGSLGQGISVGVGMALAIKRMSDNPARIFVICGEGDLNEGISTEALRLASHFNLTNFTLLVDYNGKMSDRHSQVMVNPQKELEALGFLAEPCDGHSFHSLRSMLALAHRVETRPMAIICKTVKGKGVPAWESDLDGMHGSVCLNDDDLKMALEAINEQ